MCWAPTTDLNLGNESQVDVGKFGNFACDSPWELFISTLQFMKTHQPDADFILWTGDDDSHVSDYFFSSSKVRDIMRNISINIQNSFPTTPVIPTFGNHDVYPKCLFSPDIRDSWYLEVANVWKHWLGEEAYQNFQIGGYYQVAHPTLPNVTIIALNTVIFIECVTLVNDTTDADPLNQLTWLNQTLQELKKQNKKAYITAHVPPGVLGGAPPYDSSWFRSSYNKLYVDIIIENAETIIGQFYGHEHSDSFRLYYSSEDVYPVNALFVAPAVTPWQSNNNPSVRLFTYNLETGQVTNYEQYYLNLTEANELGEANWKKEYDFLSAYNLPDMSYQSLDRLAQGFATHNRTYLDKYYVYFSVSYDPNDYCDRKCQRSLYCGATQLDYNAFDQCNNPNITNCDNY